MNEVLKLAWKLEVLYIVVYIQVYWKSWFSSEKVMNSLLTYWMTTTKTNKSQNLADYFSLASEM